MRSLLHLGVAQGIRSILAATALASVALRVDTALAIPGIVELFGAESSLVSDTAEAIDGAALRIATISSAMQTACYSCGTER